MIAATVGRVVHYWVRQGFRGNGPNAAIVAFVYMNNVVNLMVIRESGETYSAQGISHWDGEGMRPTTAHWEWMAYQKAVAKGEIAPNLYPTKEI